MKETDLRDSITDLPGKTVEKVETHRFRKQRRWVHFAAVAAALALAAGLGGLLARHIGDPGRDEPPVSTWTPGGVDGSGPGGGAVENGCSYMLYYGPVMPLTATEGAERVTAVRRVEYDFSPYGENLRQAVVTDSCTLKNTENRDVRLSLLYPVPMTIEEAAQGRIPRITVDGSEQEPALYAGPCTGNLINCVDEATNPFAEKANFDEDEASWEAYAAHLSDGSYQAAALAPAPDLNVPVIVYKVDDYVLGPEYTGECPTLQISFAVDFGKTALMSYGADGGSSDRESGVYASMRGSLDWDENAFPRKPMYIVVYGGDVAGYTLQGYQDMSCAPGKETDITATVTRYETTMYDFLCQIVDEHLADPEYGWTDVRKAFPADFMYRLAAGFLAQYEFLNSGRDGDWLDSALESVFEAYSKRRVLYFAFDVTIPAGESVDVTATMRRDGNVNPMGESRNTGGYDLAVCLGSTLRFTEQQAVLSNADHVEILDNSFGFRGSSSGETVTLDPAEEHCWMNVAPCGIPVISHN